MVASANPDKAKEIVAILSAAMDVELVPRPADVPDVVEDGETLLDNARLKARALVAATGVAAVADDTGLEVDALGGAPGVYSARYAGEDATYADNVAKLLHELAALEDGGGARRAWFRTVALVAFPDGSEVWCEGVLEGSIATAPRGDNGFGYDPVFVPPGRKAGTDGPLPRWPRPRRTPSRTAGAPSAPWPDSSPGAGKPERCSAPAELGPLVPGLRVARLRGPGRPPAAWYPESGNSAWSATTWMQTWSAPAARCSWMRDATVAASPHGMTASIRRSLPPPSMSASL